MAADFFNKGVVAVLAALDGVTPEEEALKLLEEEEDDGSD